LIWKKYIFHDKNKEEALLNTEAYMELYFDSKNEYDELIIFTYERLENIWSDKKYKELSSQKAFCKIKTAPRKFERCYMCNAKTPRIYYWSPMLGAHVFNPFWKEKNGIYYIDEKECIEMTRLAAQEETMDFFNPETEKILAFLNKASNMRDKKCSHCRFEKNGYIRYRDFYFDWPDDRFDFHYKQGVFQIENNIINKIYVNTRMEQNVWNSEIINTICGASWSKEQLLKFLLSLDSYDSYVELVYMSDKEQKKENISMSGHHIRYCSDFFGLKNRLIEILDWDHLFCKINGIEPYSKNK